MDTEKYCNNLESLDKKEAIKAIHEAYLQLNALGKLVNIDGLTYDNKSVLINLQKCLAKAGHIGFN